MTCDDDYSALRGRFARSFLNLLILRMLRHEPLWGYKMMSILRSDYGIRVVAPTIYPLLGSMEADGLVESEEVHASRRRRRVYRATHKGLDLLKCFEDVLSGILEDFGQSV